MKGGVLYNYSCLCLNWKSSILHENREMFLIIYYYFKNFAKYYSHYKKGTTKMLKRKKHKRIVFVILITFLLMVFTGCASESDPKSISETGEKTIKMSFSGLLPPSHPVSEMQKWFAEEVNKRTEGRVDIEVYVGGELYDDHQGAIEAVSSGALDLAYSSCDHWGPRNPVFGFSSFFWQVRDLDHWDKIRDGVYEIVAPLYESYNVKLLNFVIYGECGVASIVPIRSPEDIKGLKIRGPEPGTLHSLESLGGIPARIAPSEVYDALDKGSIDGALSGWSSFYSRKFYEVCDYFMGPLWNPLYINFMNLDTWNELPADIQDIIMEVSREAEELTKESAKKYDKESMDFLKEHGELTYLTPEELDYWFNQFKEEVYEKIWLEECKEAGYENEGRALLNTLFSN